jgi:hypothetical protein
MALATPFIAHAINVLLRCDDPRADDGNDRIGRLKPWTEDQMPARTQLGSNL